jgi:hypothetical protein
MPKLLSEMKFGRLRIVRKVKPDIYLCQCDCGNTIELWRSQLFCNVKKHCGCVPYRSRRRLTFMAEHIRVYKKRAGGYRSRTTWEYNSWKGLTERCYCKGNDGYENWGGRGIRVCERWLLPKGEGFRNFCSDMGPRPQGMSIDRINPQGHYEPTNCRWATKDVQIHNQRRFIWKDTAPPPIEKVTVMNERVDDWTGELQEAF